MAVAAAVLHNDALVHLASATGAQWNDGAANFAFILLGNGYTQSAADTTYANISANEIADVDYSPIAAATRVITNSSGQAQFSSAPADFGNTVTITAKFLACVQGNPASLGGTDKVIFTIDLDDTSGTATKSSTADDFDITPAASGWFYIDQV